MYCKVFMFYISLQRKCKLLTSKHLKEMNVDNAKSQMRKGMLEYCIMLLLSEKADSRRMAF